MQVQYNRLMTMYRTDVAKLQDRIVELEKEIEQLKAKPVKKEVKKK